MNIWWIFWYIYHYHTRYICIMMNILILYGTGIQILGSCSAHPLLWSLLKVIWRSCQKPRIRLCKKALHTFDYFDTFCLYSRSTKERGGPFKTVGSNWRRGCGPPQALWWEEEEISSCPWPNGWCKLWETTGKETLGDDKDIDLNSTTFGA